MRVLIIADAPGLVNLPTSKYDKIIALDGVAVKLQKAGFVPDIIIGDMDELTPLAADYFTTQGVKILKIDDQNSTDMDKGIEYADSIGAKEITITNALGGRIDHTLYNIRILRKYYRLKRPVMLVNYSERAQYFCNCNIEMQGKSGDAIAILAMPKATVTSVGLKYNMENYKLDFGFTESACNSMFDTQVQIKLKGEILAVYADNIRVVCSSRKLCKS